MKNEFDKPIQGVSHRAVRSFDLFYVAIKYNLQEQTNPKLKV